MAGAYAATPCAAACAPFKNSPGTYATCCKQHAAVATRPAATPCPSVCTQFKGRPATYDYCCKHNGLVAASKPKTATKTYPLTYKPASTNSLIEPVSAVSDDFAYQLTQRGYRPPQNVTNYNYNFTSPTTGPQTTGRSYACQDGSQFIDNNGAFPTKLTELIHERKRYREFLRLEYEKPAENQQPELIGYYQAKQIALKLLANAGYGCFAKKEFAYSDYRVSEIITGFGRLIHKELEKIGHERYGFQTIFGFTDSIFIRHGNQSNTNPDEQIVSFIQDCKKELDIDIDHKNRSMFTIIFSQKNRYISWTGRLQDRPILKNLDGMSRRYPKWIKQQVRKNCNSFNN